MDQMRIGAYLKELRKEKNLTQEQIAEKFGVSQRSVSRWENGYTMPDISILIELADYYDEEVEMAVQSLMAAMEPMIIVVLAGVCGILIGACMAPMLSMYGALDKL